MTVYPFPRVEIISGTVNVDAIRSQNYNSVLLINTTVDPDQTITSNHIAIDKFRTKTISGYSTFNGTLKIYVAPTTNPASFYPYPYYTADISANNMFSFSFTESFALVMVEVTNTSSSSGNIVVYVTMSVL